MNKKLVLIAIVILILLSVFFAYRQSNINKLKQTQQEQTTQTSKDDELVCTDTYDPVCWVNDQTYSSECVATKINNVEVQYKWQCKEKVEENTWSSNWIDSNWIESTWSESTEISSNSWSNISTWAINSASWTVSGDKVQKYDNTRLGYGFSLPYNVYFSWYGSKWWSTHSVWINSWTWTDTFEDSAVKLFFYKWKILDELKDSYYWLYEDKTNWRKYIKLWDNSVIIEALPWNEKIVDTIIKTIYAN